jgi:hypothetical protein
VDSNLESMNDLVPPSLIACAYSQNLIVYNKSRGIINSCVNFLY